MRKIRVIVLVLLSLGIPYLVFVVYVNLVTYQRFGTPPHTHFGVIIVKSDGEMKKEKHWYRTGSSGRPEVWAWSDRNFNYWDIWENYGLITPVKGRSKSFLERCREIR